LEGKVLQARVAFFVEPGRSGKAADSSSKVAESKATFIPDERLAAGKEMRKTGIFALSYTVRKGLRTGETWLAVNSETNVTSGMVRLRKRVGKSYSYT
jgi:imidazolonepropionase-like amidohydrolase